MLEILDVDPLVRALPSETTVTDAGLKHLAGLSNLREPALPDAGVTAQGRAGLSAALPGCQSESTGTGEGPGEACGPVMNPKLMALALNDGFRLDHFLGGLVIRVEDAGELSLASGQVVACDPGYLSFPGGWPPFARTLPPGRYPVRVSVVHLDTGAVRVAQAALGPRPRPACPIRAGDPAGRGRGHAGTGRILSRTASTRGRAAFWTSRLPERSTSGARDGKTTGREFSRTWPSVMAAHWSNSVLAPDSGLNMVMFPSGIGDGRYPSFWGFDAADRLVCLVTDFQLLVGGEAYPSALPRVRGGGG